jgi:hypothetical protein
MVLAVGLADGADAFRAQTRIKLLLVDVKAWRQANQGCGEKATEHHRKEDGCEVSRDSPCQHEASLSSAVTA